MRITLLQLATLLILVGCNREQNRFDVKSQEFIRKQSHHYSQQFADSSVQDEVDVSNNVVKSENQTEIVDIEPEIIISDSSNKKSMFSGLINMFTSSDEKIDSLDKVINDCEERLYTSTDEANSQQGAINSLISERNYLLMQLDSLQTVIVSSKRTSNRRLVELQNDQRKLKSLIELLSSEIE
jgi:hypothetical protein